MAAAEMTETLVEDSLDYVGEVGEEWDEAAGAAAVDVCWTLQCCFVELRVGGSHWKEGIPANCDHCYS